MTAYLIICDKTQRCMSKIASILDKCIYKFCVILTKHGGVCGYALEIIHLHALEAILFAVSGKFSKWESYLVHKIFSAMGGLLVCVFWGASYLE